MSISPPVVPLITHSVFMQVLTYKHQTLMGLQKMINVINKPILPTTKKRLNKIFKSLIFKYFIPLIFQSKNSKSKVIYPPNRDMASRHSTGYSLLIGQELMLEHEYAGGKIFILYRNKISSVTATARGEGLPQNLYIQGSDKK